jgi:hypothetical protein
MRVLAAPRPRRRAGGAVIVVIGVLCGVVAFNGWRATPARAAELFSFDFHSGARGARFFMIDSKNGNQEGAVPEASANLASGPVGYGLAAAAWPGPLAANAGSLILVLQPTAPSQVNMLNDPIRAEARTGQNPSTTKYDSVPGVVMTATAKSDVVEADANVQNLTGDTSTFGPMHVHSSTTNTGSTGKAGATSLVQDVNIGAGVVKIQSVSSTATATTDGLKADGTAATTVNGMTISGTPATIDENGLHIGDQSQPLNKAVNDAAQQALSQAGISIVLSAPNKSVKDGGADVQAGSLIVTWVTGGDNPTFIWTLGGAQASVAAAPAPDETASVSDGTSGGAAGGSIGSVADTSAAGISPGGLGIASGVAGSGSPTGVATSGGANDAAFTPAAAIGGQPTRAGWVILGVLAAVLVGLGLRRLTDDLLADRTATVCPLQDGDR